MAITVTPQEKLEAALQRYRVLSFVTGTFLLLLCVEMVAKYVLRGGEPWLGMWVSQVHGLIYIVYLVTVMDVWTRAKAGWRMLAAMVLAGVVPVLSFWQERKTTVKVRELMARMSQESAAG